MIRIVGLSATLPNYRDVGRFLGVNSESGEGWGVVDWVQRSVREGAQQLWETKLRCVPAWPGLGWTDVSEVPGL